MRRNLVPALALVIAFAACGDDGGGISDPHERVTCETAWYPDVLTCDAACAVMASVPSATACVLENRSCAPDSVVDVEGFRGCCSPGSQGGELRMLFEPCR